MTAPFLPKQVKPTKPKPMTEAQLQDAVIKLAHVLGWSHMHCRRSIGKHGRWVTATNVPWPDLTLWHPKHGFMVRELKVRNVFQPGQRDTLDGLSAAGVNADVWTPKDLDSGRIVAELRGRETGA